jgi:hypothetical protein
VADLITVLLSRSGDADDEEYRAALHGQVAEQATTNLGTVRVLRART